MDDLPGRVITVPSAGCDSVQPVVVAETKSLPDEDVDETPSAGSVGLEHGKSCKPQDTVREGDPTIHILATHGFPKLWSKGKDTPRIQTNLHKHGKTPQEGPVTD